MRPPQKQGPKTAMNRSLSIRNASKQRNADLGETDTTSGTDDDAGSGEESIQTAGQSSHYRAKVSKGQRSHGEYTSKSNSVAVRENSDRVMRSVGESRQIESVRRKTNKPVKHRRKGAEFRNFVKNYKKLTARVDFMIARAPFSRVVREIMMSLDTDVKFITQTAFEALQAATEAYVEGRLEDANLLALHARRVTLMVKDLELINFLRSNGR